MRVAVMLGAICLLGSSAAAMEFMTEQKQTRPERPTAAPQIVSLKITTKAGIASCTGSVVGKDKILTAGHCTSPGSTYLVKFIGGHTSVGLLIARGGGGADWALLAATTGNIVPINIKSLPRPWNPKIPLTVFSFPENSSVQIAYPAFVNALTPTQLRLITVVRPGDSGSPVLFLDKEAANGVSMAGIIVSGFEEVPGAFAVPAAQFKTQVEEAH